MQLAPINQTCCAATCQSSGVAPGVSNQISGGSSATPTSPLASPESAGGISAPDVDNDSVDRWGGVKEKCPGVLSGWSEQLRRGDSVSGR